VIEINQLTKQYGSQLAVNNISFKANKGEIVGFLGPNGAGKTTTMKIITCFIPQTAGNINVCGFNTATHPMEVRQRIGYLPEHNPIYKDMYVKEYLHFVAQLHKIPQPQKQINNMIERTGLTREQNKIIGTLSKGYRQRVGLAQAMLHNPEVLILDEPTSGLDPNQLVEIRQLIKDLGQEKTVIFSTHIMQEVQQLCNRVVIINKGQLVADDPIESLQQRVAGQNIVTISFLENTTAQTIQNAIPNITQIQQLAPNTWQVTSPAQTDIRPQLFQFAVQQQLTLIEMHLQTATIENVFQQLTK
jgi:ABC-2 type transport system ATP-binding protein